MPSCAVQTDIPAPEQAELHGVPRRPVSPPTYCRAFTTLSEALGHTVASLHRGLAQGVQCESAPLVLAAQLRALQSLAAACPYHRLPPSLLGVVSAVRPAPQLARAVLHIALT